MKNNFPIPKLEKKIFSLKNLFLKKKSAEKNFIGKKLEITLMKKKIIENCLSWVKKFSSKKILIDNVFHRKKPSEKKNFIKILENFFHQKIIIQKNVYRIIFIKKRFSSIKF